MVEKYRKIGGTAVLINAAASGVVIYVRAGTYNENISIGEPLSIFAAIKYGILDPTKVVRIALQNASSIAGLLLTTEGLVAELPEEEKGPKYPTPPGGDMY